MEVGGCGGRVRGRAMAGPEGRDSSAVAVAVCVAGRTLHYAKSILILALTGDTEAQTEPFICSLLGVIGDE